jgi:hypothetical protein
MTPQIKPKYWKKIQRYIENDKITINTNNLEQISGDILLMHRIKRTVGAPTLKDLKKVLKK